MIKYSRRPRDFPRHISLLAAFAIACSAALALSQEPAPQWERVRSEAPVFSLEVPADWRFQEVEGRGARIVPPDGGPVVEVVAWNALRPPATPDTAAIEHEGVLGRVVDYRRDGMEQITTDEGAPALVVSGRVRWRGTTEDSIFCAYSEGATHYILGTFAPKETLVELRASVLDRMMRSFRAEAGAAPVSRPPQPVPEPEPLEPEPDLEPDPPDDTLPGPEVGEAQAGGAPTTLQVGGHLEPMGPEVREPRAPWIEHLNPSGFSVSIPIDWEVEIVDGLISLTPARAEAGSGVVLIWPVTGADPGAEAALRMALTRVPDLSLTRVTSIEETAGVTVAGARASGGRRLAATWAHDGAFGLLQVIAAPEGAWHGLQPKLARMAASFRPGQWPVAYRRETEVTGEMGLLRWELPVGWEARGGVREDAGQLAIDIEAVGPSVDALRVRWQQPVAPRFRALTPLLESLGWRESERYSAPEGGEGLTIFRRRNPEQLVRDLLLPRHAPQLRLTAIDARPSEGAVADLLPQAAAVGQVVTVEGGSETGPRERLYLAASVSAEAPLSTTCWDAAFLEAGAPEGQLAQAVDVLATLVRSAVVSDEAGGRPAERLQELVERAQRALGSIPADLRPAPRTGLSNVIGGDEPDAAAATWTLPGESAVYWIEQAGDEGTVNIPGAETRPGG